MKIISVLGSPNPDGSSARIAKYFLKIAEENGAFVEQFALNKMNYRDCQGCKACKTLAESCVLKDDLTKTLESINDADILLLSTPVYVLDIPGQVKSFIDRCFSFVKPDFTPLTDSSRLAKGKKLVFIQTQGGAENMFRDVHTRYEAAFKRIGFTDSYVIRACSVLQDEDITRRIEIIDQAGELARKLVQ